MLQIEIKMSFIYSTHTISIMILFPFRLHVVYKISFLDNFFIKCMKMVYFYSILKYLSFYMIVLFKNMTLLAV